MNHLDCREANSNNEGDIPLFLVAFLYGEAISSSCKWRSCRGRNKS